MNQSQSIVNLAPAFVRAQAKMPVVKFDKKNPHMSYKYATLGAVIEASRPILAEFGLSIIQFPITATDGRIGVRSVLLHETGEFMEDVIVLSLETGKGLSNNQGAGVTITYLRRYAWAAILGLVADEDTDGDDGTNANAVAGAVMKERVWSIAQMETIIENSAGAVTEHEDAKSVLDLSALPVDAPTKTVASWFSHYLKSDGKTPLIKASDANNAYIEAKNKSKSGGK